MKASRFFGLVVVLTLLMTLSQTIVSDSDTGLSAGTTYTVNAYDTAGNESRQSEGVLGLGESAEGATINVASCEQADVQTAIDSASDGDTVIVPAGNCTWSGSVGIPDDKKITLQGAGMDSTVITRSPTGTAVSLGQSGSRLTGFGFIGGYVNVDGDGWRIDHCRFYSESSFMAGVYARGNRENDSPSGLVDHCVFYNQRVLVCGWAGLLAHSVWAQPLGLGTEKAVYVEDCEFTGSLHSNAMDTNYGGSYVFRYNTLNDIYIEAHSVQGTHRATRKWEIYNNTFNQVSRAMWVPMMIRGGTGVVFNNTVTGTWTNPNIALDNVRSCDSRGDGGRCDGASLWDGNEAGEAGYPCRDQIGRSTDQWLWTDENPYPPQAHEPAYAWNNKHGANDVIFFQHACAESRAHIQPGRDYFNNVQKPGYTSYTYPHPLTLTEDTTPPTRSNPQPTGILSSGTTSTTISIATNETATCKYATTPNTAYASMPNTFSSTNSTSHSQTITGLSNGNSYTYYVRCQDEAGNANTDDYPIAFSVAEPLVLRGIPANQAIHLTWTVNTTLPPTSTWQIAYDGPTGDQPSPITGIVSPTRAYTLTGLTNYTWYTVTLRAMSGSASLLANTVMVMPTDIFVYLPLTLKEH